MGEKLQNFAAIINGQALSGNYYSKVFTYLLSNNSMIDLHQRKCNAGEIVGNH